MQYNIDMEYKFAKRLKELRLENKLSTTDLAKAIGTSDASISRWENEIQRGKLNKVA